MEVEQKLGKKQINWKNKSYVICYHQMFYFNIFSLIVSFVLIIYTPNPAGDFTEAETD